MSAFAVFTETQNALRDAKVRTGLNSMSNGMLAVSCKQGSFRVELVTKLEGKGGKCQVCPLTDFVHPSAATAFLRSYNG